MCLYRAIIKRSEGAFFESSHGIRQDLRELLSHKAI